MLSILIQESPDCLASILRCLAPGGRLLLDITYGCGRLVSNMPPGWRVVGSDLNAKTHVQADAGCLPYRMGCADVVLYDPPYLYGRESRRLHGGPNAAWTAERSRWDSPEQLVRLSDRVAGEAYRVARVGGLGVVKVADSRLGGRLVRNHDLVMNAYEKAGWVLDELLVYARLGTGMFAVARRAQNAHGFWLIFKKEALCPT